MWQENAQRIHICYLDFVRHWSYNKEMRKLREDGKET